MDRFVKHGITSKVHDGLKMAGNGRICLNIRKTQSRQRSMKIKCWTGTNKSDQTIKTQKACHSSRRIVKLRVIISLQLKFTQPLRSSNRVIATRCESAVQLNAACSIIVGAESGSLFSLASTEWAFIAAMYSNISNHVTTWQRSISRVYEALWTVVWLSLGGLEMLKLDLHLNKWNIFRGQCWNVHGCE